MVNGNVVQFFLNEFCESKAPWNVDTISQKEMAERIVELIEIEPRAANRDCFPAHLTGSAFVLDSTLQFAALIFHKKIKKWMQPGGHADGDFLLERVAWREAFEETGISDLRFVSFPGLSGVVPFDVDIHQIPSHGHVPEHFHFDARFLLVAPENACFIQPDEVDAIEWVSLQTLNSYTNERSVLRMAEKALFLCKESVLPSLYKESLRPFW